MVSQLPAIILIASTFCMSWAQDFYDDHLDASEIDRTNSSIFVGRPPKEIKLDRYLTASELEDLLEELADNHGDVVRVTSIGKSAVDNTSIWAVEITHDAKETRKLLKPMFKFVANMHGDEAVGYALMVSLIQYLVYSDGVDPRITRLLDDIDVWIVPTLNPDGLRRAEQGRCSSLADYVGRENGDDVDLNRNFPDQFEHRNKIYEPETWAIMNFIHNYPFVLSGNLHGGAIVASYPFDSSDSVQDYGVASLTPDNEFFVELAKGYASNNPMMAPGTACGNNFPGGITNGNYWYKVLGGMQDFNYVFSNCFEMTMELSCCKFPAAAQLPIYWNANLASMLDFIESTRQGIYGLVKDTQGRIVPFAIISVKGIGKVIRGTENGEYWRLLLPGQYTVTASATAAGYRNSTQKLTVTKDEPYVRHDFVLKYSYDWKN